MRLLLDTHVAIWSVAHSQQIGRTARALIENETGRIFVSAISILEIAIKWSLPVRNDRPPFSAADARHFFADRGYLTLPITDAHAEAVATLKQLHSDPFDRLLVAQALTEPLRLLTADEHVLSYDGGFIDARV